MKSNHLEKANTAIRQENCFAEVNVQMWMYKNRNWQTRNPPESLSMKAEIDVSKNQNRKLLG